MPQTTEQESSKALNSSFESLKELQLLYLFSSTLLSTMQLNKLLHLILSSLVYEDNSLFCRSLLFLYNKKTNALQGMLGVCRTNADGLHLVSKEPDNPLSGHWELDEAEMKKQWNSDFCAKVRKIRVDLNDDCNFIEKLVEDRRLCDFHTKDLPPNSGCDFLTDLGINSFAVVPLLTRNNLIGLIIVDNPFKHQPFTDKQLQLLQLFANQSGMAIENTRLYRNLEEAHEELQTTRQRLIHGAHLAAIGEMAASISHELKTPLITIGGFAARLGKMIPEGDSKRHYLDTIINESHRLEQLLGDILAFSRKPTICYQCCDLKALLEECIDDYDASLVDQNIAVSTDFKDADWIVLGDPNQLKQICINLMGNAQDAMPGGGELHLALNEIEEGGCKKIVVSIADTGGGITEDIMDKIFTPFFTTKRHGTGLGLAIVNRIVQNHGGVLMVRNMGKGAEFRIILPKSSSSPCGR